MGTKYTRNDTSNNIADGNIINATDLDGEFDAVQAAFATSGHTHDGTVGEGGPVTVVGPAQDLVISATNVNPKTTNTLDLGTSSLLYKDAYLTGTVTAATLDISGNVDIDGTLETDALTINGSALVLTANDFTDADHSKLDGIEASATADQSSAEIRTAVEAATDSNVFTDADHTKLNAIEASATADQSDAEIRTAVEAASDSNVFTDADHSKLNAIEASADVTDATNVTAAGALMDSELSDLAGVKGVTISTLQVKPSEGAFANGDKTKLDAVEASADVTDTANVTSAGALMDSEVTNLAQVKAFDESDYATAAQGATADAALPKAGGAMTGAITTNSTFDGRDVATDGTKLDGIEASATADQSNAEIRTAVEAATDSNVFTDADHTKLNSVAASANNYVHPNHSGEVTSNADGATVIAAEVVDEANLKISNSPVNGYMLTAQSGDAGGLTWAESAPVAGSSSIVTTGALNSGSITSGFGVINNGASAITTTGVVSGVGSGLTALNGSNISSGTVAAARIPTLNQDTTGSAATLTTARTIGGTSFDGSANIAVGLATVATTVTVTDNESTNENNSLIFAAGGDADGGNLGLESDGDLHYNPSTGTLSVPHVSVSGTFTTVDSVHMNASNGVVFEGSTPDAHETTLTSVDATADRTITLPNVSGTVPVLAAASNTQVTSTPEELNKLDGATVVVGEINALDLGSTAIGTAIASKAVVLDANKDYTGVRNFTVSGELDAATGDFSGNVDVDGTLEADAITVNGTALATVIAGTTVTNATNAAHVSVADNESTNEENLITFIEGASATGNVGLESDGNLSYNPSTGTVTATVFKGNVDAVDIDVDGTLEADAITIGGTAIASVLSPVAGSSSIVTTGALNSGSITSGFGAINNGASAITTTGVGTFGSLDISGDVDVDGTLEADAITINGTALSVGDGGLTSNNFTDADHTKLNGIEASATADQTAAEIKTLLEDGIDSVHYVDGSIDTAHIGDDQVTADKLANSINAAIAANTAKDTNVVQTTVTGNAGSATVLQNARTIGGVSFNGSANINLPGVNSAGNQNTSGSAATLTTARTIAGVSFNGSANIALNNNAITNGAGYTTNTGDITGVTAGSGLSGGGTSGTVTLSVATLNQNTTGSAGSVATADESSDTTCFITYATAASGNLPMKTGTNLLFNSSSGLVTSVDYTVTSDARHKYDVQDLNVTWDEFNKIRPVTHRWNEDKGPKGVHQGLIAQEVQEVYPEFVVALDDGTLTINYPKMIPMLINTIKNLNNRLEALENK